MIVALSVESPILHKWRNSGTHACIYTRIWIYKSTNATTHDPLCILYFKHVLPDTIVCWYSLRTVLTLIRHDKASSLIGIQTDFHTLATFLSEFEQNQQMHYNLQWVSNCRPPAEQKCNSQATDNWHRDYKTFFMLNSSEHIIYTAYKC